MGSNAVDISAIINYAGTYQKELITLAVTENEVSKKMTLLPGIKKKHTMTTLQFESLLKPYIRAWTPNTDKASLKPRTIETELGQVELEEEPLAYRNTWLANIMQKGVNPTDHPFEKEFLEGIVKKVAEDINMELAFWGEHDPLGTSAKDVNDGFFTIIDAEIAAGNISVAEQNLINTGDIDNGNALEQLKTFYRTACGYNPALRGKMIKMFISHEIMDAYNDNYQTVVGPIVYNQQFEKRFLEGSGGLCLLEPMTGMKSTKRIMMGPVENFIYGCDLLSDEEKIEIWKPQPKTVGFFLACNLGFNFNTLKLLWTNEAAVDSGSGS